MFIGGYYKKTFWLTKSQKFGILRGTELSLECLLSLQTPVTQRLELGRGRIIWMGKSFTPQNRRKTHGKLYTIVVEREGEGRERARI